MRFLILLIAVVAVPAAAQTAYVTDILRLGLHQAEDTSDRAFRTLESGQEMEILSRTPNYARVRLPDGTEGYVKAAYLVNEKPARLIVSEVQAASDALREDLEETRASFAEPAALIESLESQLGGLNTELDQEREARAQSEARLDRLESRQANLKYSLPMTWVAMAIGVALLGGFFGGLRWVDYQSRKRHGGIRIY